MKKFTEYALGALAVLIGAIYVYYWRFGYNADYAVIGLLAKHILETGEQFIFVPNVGYQGLLYEGNMVALMFHLFGINPMVLNYSQFISYLAFLFIFYRAVRTWHSSLVAQIATLYLIVCSPTLCKLLLRTQPNYGETYLLGSALILIYRKLILGRNEKSQKYSDNPTLDDSDNSNDEVRYYKPWKLLGLYGLFGLISGFGLYTYGQIIYFIGAIGLHLSFFFILDFHRRSQKEKLQLKTYFRVLKFLSIYGAFGLICFLANFDETHIFHKKLTWMPFAIIEFSLVGAVLTIWIAKLQTCLKTLRAYSGHGFMIVIGFLIGYFPKIYYNLIQGIRSKAGGLGRGGSASEFANRLKFFIEGQADLVGYGEPKILTYLILIITASFVFYFIFNNMKLGFQYFAQTKDSKNDKPFTTKKMISISPFFFLYWIVIASYLSSTSVTDILTIRYAVVLFLASAVAVGKILDTLYKSKEFTLAKAASSVAFGVLILLNINALGLSLKDANKPDVLEHVATYLTHKDIHFGYSFYWFGYPINLLTQENIILDPLGSNYTPYYRTRVQAANRIAYVDKIPYILGENVKPMQDLMIFGMKYRVLEKQPFDSLDVFILEKV